MLNHAMMSELTADYHTLSKSLTGNFGNFGNLFAPNGRANPRFAPFRLRSPVHYATLDLWEKNVLLPVACRVPSITVEAPSEMLRPVPAYGTPTAKEGIYQTK